MRYLGLALFAEGPTDHRFLHPLLHRLADELCLQAGQEIVEIGEVIELHSPAQTKKEDRETRILEAARAAWGAFHILFLHSDGGGDPVAAVQERVQPAATRITGEPESDRVRTVAVVPVRETEAWALADGDALRTSLGTVLDDQALGLPEKRHEIESITDPKQFLQQIYAKVIGKKARKKRAANILNVLGERIGFHCLREMSAFTRFEEEFRKALEDLGFLRRRDS